MLIARQQKGLNRVAKVDQNSLCLLEDNKRLKPIAKVDQVY